MLVHLSSSGSKLIFPFTLDTSFLGSSAVGALVLCFKLHILDECGLSLSFTFLITRLYNAFHIRIRFNRA